MKLTIAKDTLLKGLQMVQSVIASHSTLPILYNVLLTANKDKLQLTATDLSVSIRCTLDATVSKPGMSTVNAKRFLGIVRDLPDASVDIEIDDKNTAAINSGASSFKIFGLQADEFPPLPPFETAQTFSLEQNTLKEMLKKTAYAASIDESRQILNGILLSIRGQKLSMVATDGRRLALIEQEVEIPGDLKIDIVIPSKTVQELIKWMGDDGIVDVKTMGHMAAFEMGDTLIISKLIEGNYPNFRQVIPAQCEERVMISREGLMAALKRVAILTNEKYSSIKVAFEKNQILVTAVTPEIGEAKEVLPVKYTGKAMSMAFNPEFLIDPLKTLASDEVSIELSDDLSPAVLKCDIPFLYVLMPLRLS